MKSGQLLLLLSVLSAAPHTLADPQCTDEPKDKWQDQAAFQENLKAEGYDIKKFKVTDTSCYEIYAWNRDKKKVEIYFNPVDGSIVKQEVDD